MDPAFVTWQQWEREFMRRCSLFYLLIRCRGTTELTRD